MKINLKYSHFEQIIKNGYNLDMVFLLQLIEKNNDVKTLCCEIPKLEAICQAIYRKGLVTENYAITTLGKELLAFLETDGEEKFVKKKNTDEGFDAWWKAYPGTDTFVHNDKKFSGTRSLRQKKDDCKLKFNKILNEGEYTADELIQALEYEVLQKKENSVKTKTNKLSFMQNSLTYLNQRTFEPFIELIREGSKIQPSNPVQGGTDI